MNMRITVISATLAAKTSKAAKRKLREDLIESDSGQFFLDLINIHIKRDANLGRSFTTIYLSSEIKIRNHTFLSFSQCKGLSLNTIYLYSEIKIRNHIFSSDILDAISWVLSEVYYKVLVLDGKFIKISWADEQC